MPSDSILGLQKSFPTLPTSLMYRQIQFWVFFFFFFGNKCFIKQSFKNYNAILKVVTWIKGIKVQLDKGYLSGLILNMDTQYK